MRRGVAASPPPEFFEPNMTLDNLFNEANRILIDEMNGVDVADRYKELKAELYKHGYEVKTYGKVESPPISKPDSE